jgi:hypothetical protein
MVASWAAKVGWSAKKSSFGTVSYCATFGDMAERLHVAAGDDVFALKTDNGILITPYDPGFDRRGRPYPAASPAVDVSPSDLLSRCGFGGG